MRVAIVGGGMAGLAAAWRLSDPAGPPTEITVYQRGWRLGGKGASSRGPNGRIEEHGLHVWLGYYDNAFRLIRECYEELDRPTNDPACPILTWRDAFSPTGPVGLAHDDSDAWDEWLAWFPENDRQPGDPAVGDDAIDVAQMVRQLVELAGRFGSSVDPQYGRGAPRAALTSSRIPPARPSALAEIVTGFRTAVRQVAGGGVATERTRRFLELLGATIRGIVADGLLTRGFGAVDHVDLRDWLRSHGASDAALDSPFVRGSYDLAFAYEGGDLSRPRFAAGTGLVLAGRMFLAYRGAMFWRMQAGMGDVVFAPLYEALRGRGVRFEFFHRLDAVHPSADGTQIESIDFARQVRLAPGVDLYDPLVRVKGLPAFSDRIDLAQVDAPIEVVGEPLESAHCSWPDAEHRTLEAGRDFDHLVLAVSVGMIPSVAPEVLQQSAAWRAMVDNVGTVATQAMQVWLRDDERQLGRSGPPAIITGCGAPFDTYASMTHTIAMEDWPATDPARAAAAFCAVLPDPTGADDPTAVVAAGAATFLDRRGGDVWPRANDGSSSFRWDVLCGVEEGTDPVAAISTQHVRANVDPSDRYVQSLPGSARHRLRADASGYANLALAGDWIDTGLNAGCIEAATLGGLQAANSVQGRPIHHATSGFRPNSEGHD